MIIKALKLATFIPWILYFIEIILYRIGVIESKELDKKKYFAHINKNFFTSFNMKELFLFSVFLIFMQYENTTVLEILFATVYIYLLIDFFHTLAEDCKKIKHKGLMAQAVLLVIAVVLFFICTNHLYTTYIIMFTVSLMSSFLLYFFSVILKYFKK